MSFGRMDTAAHLTADVRRSAHRVFGCAGTRLRLHSACEHIERNWGTHENVLRWPQLRTMDKALDVY